jgi:hypothetical protein
LIAATAIGRSSRLDLGEKQFGKHERTVGVLASAHIGSPEPTKGPPKAFPRHDRAPTPSSLKCLCLVL